MGPRFDRLRCEVFQNLFLSPMNTGSVRPAVATTPTACGIETTPFHHIRTFCFIKLQQHLPPAVLKHHELWVRLRVTMKVATTPTACGIETLDYTTMFNNMDAVATPPTACGIETLYIFRW